MRVPLGVLRWGPGEVSGTTPTRSRTAAGCSGRSPTRRRAAAGGRPGRRPARAVRRIRRRGGGCICLLPGDHVLHEPLRLAGAADVRIEGFGLSSRLIAGPEMGIAPVFDLTGSSGVAFRSFAILQRSAAGVFECAGTEGLTLEDMLVVCRVEPTARPAIEIRDTGCAGWRIEDSVLFGSSCLRGLRLRASRVTGCTFAAVDRGIDLSDMLDVDIAENRFVAVSANAEQGIEANVGREAPRRRCATVDGLERAPPSASTRGSSRSGPLACSTSRSTATC